MYRITRNGIFALAALALTAGLLGACSSSDEAGDDASGGVEVVATVVASGATTTDTEDSDQEMAETIQGIAFAEYYQSNCAVCHGAQRQGVVGPALTGATLNQDDQLYVDTVTNGRPGTAMPAWGRSGLTAAEIVGLVRWLKTDDPQ